MNDVKHIKQLATITLLLSLLPLGKIQADERLKLQQVTNDVYAIVGELGNRSPDNLGNNATFGFVVTTEGVVLIDSGSSYQGAQQIDRIVKTVTEKPIVKVINTGGQDHRWLGNGYFKNLGAEIIASEEAVKDQIARTQDQFIVLGNLVGDALVKETEAVYAGTTFKDNYRFKTGDTVFELHHTGQAHTPGDSFVWLPQEKTIFTGDIVYVERMLGILSQSKSRSWVDVFQAMAAYKPEYVVPGHGHATNLAEAKRDTYDYLNFLRESVSDFIDNGGDISAIGSVDQTRFDYLLNYDQLAGRNAQQVFTEIEWE